VSRPTDWWVIGRDRDPVPGDVWQISQSAQSAGSVAELAASVRAQLKNLASDGAVLKWIGAAGDAFRPAIANIPDQLSRMHDAYDEVSSALTEWANSLGGAQHTADQALAQARTAHGQLDSLNSQAQSNYASYTSWSHAVQVMKRQRPAVDPNELKAAVRRANTYANQYNALEHQISGVQASMSAAQQLLQQAEGIRDQAAERARHRIDAAAGDSSWQKRVWTSLQDLVIKKWWDYAMWGLTAISIGLAIALFVATSPAWLLGLAIAAVVVGAILIANAVVKYSRHDGHESKFDLVVDIVSNLPGLDALKILKGAKFLKASKAGIGITEKTLKLWNSGEKFKAAKTLWSTSLSHPLQDIKKLKEGNLRELKVRLTHLKSYQKWDDRKEIPLPAFQHDNAVKWSKEFKSLEPTLTPSQWKSWHRIVRSERLLVPVVKEVVSDGSKYIWDHFVQPARPRPMLAPGV
jgi:uncharacterized protein YukE